MAKRYRKMKLGDKRTPGKYEWRFRGAKHWLDGYGDTPIEIKDISIREYRRTLKGKEKK